MKKQTRQITIYLVSNAISITVANLVPLRFIPWWIGMCVTLGYFINKKNFK